MCTLRRLFAIIFTITLTTNLYSQSAEIEFSEILDSYFISKDKNVVNISMAYLKSTNSISAYKNALTGFFGALFYNDKGIKEKFTQRLPEIQDVNIKAFISSLLNTDMYLFYSKMKISQDYVYMNWSSYVASGDFKYIENIISVLIHSSNFKDKSLYLTGQIARSVLCDKAHRFEIVKNYLDKLKGENAYIKDLLSKEPAQIQREYMDFLLKQKKKGIWP